MPQSTDHSHAEIIALLEPRVRTEGERLALIDILFSGRTQRPNIDYSGSPGEFASRLVGVLSDFGTLGGQPALIALLDTLKPRVGDDLQAKIDILIEILRAPTTPSARAHVFISYSRTNRDFVTRLTADLQRGGVAVWIDHAGLEPGTVNWENALRTAIRDAYAVLYIGAPDAARSNYVLAELDIAEMYSVPVLPLWAAGDHWADVAPFKLVKAQYIDMRGDAYAMKLPTLTARLLTMQGKRIEPPKPPFQHINPYRGLKPFTENERHYFFGREDETEKLLTMLSDRRFVSVLGASGSGKSSLVMAGVLPALDTKQWTIISVKPDATPLLGLAMTLSNELGISTSASEEDLKRPDGLGLHIQAARVAALKKTPRVLLFIDQFEEVFTRPTEDDRRAFLDTVIAASDVRDGALTVLLTMRADFYDRAMAYPALLTKLDGHLPLGAMESERLRDAILKPAERVGLTFEDGLVGDVLFEVRDEAGALPLMQFTLDQLYRRCVEEAGGETLTLAAYRALGGVRGALVKHAETTYQSLDQAGRSLARSLFLRLIEPGVTEQDTTRRRARMSDLTLTDEEQTERLYAVADTFVKARLMTVEQPLSPRPERERTVLRATIEVAHEALIREWGTLRGWLHDSREDVLLGNALSDAAESWAARGRPADRLYRGNVLDEARAWEGRNSANAREREFIDASARAQVETLASEQKRQSQLRRASIGVVALAIVLVLTFIGSLIFQIQTQAANNNTLLGERNRAEANLREARDSQALFLADLSRQQLEGRYYQNALLLANESLSHYDEGIYHPESMTALMNALDAPAQEVLNIHHDGAVQGAAWNADETRILTWSDDGTVRVTDAATGVTLLNVTHDGNVNGATWNADETRILTWSDDGTVRVTDAATGATLLNVTHDGNVNGATWNADETRILTWSRDNTARVTDAATEETLLTIRHDDSDFGVSGAMWNADETRILTIASDTARVTDTATGETLLTIRHENFTSGVKAAWNADETRILTWSGAGDNTARVTDATSGDTLLTIRHDDSVTTAAWNADETLILTSSLDRTVRATVAATSVTRLFFRLGDAVYGAGWNADETRVLTRSNANASVTDAITGQTLFTIHHNGYILGAIWNADETRILTWSIDDTARVTDAATGETLLTIHHQVVDQGVRDATWNDDETRILTSSYDGTAKVWAWDERVSGTDLLTIHYGDSVYGADWNRNETQIITWGTISNTLITSAATDQTLLTIDHEGQVYGATWNADETRILTWSRDNTARVTDAATGDTLLIIPHDESNYGVTGVVWNADETRILTWSGDNTARVTDAATEETLLTIRHYDSDFGVSGAMWNADETRILTSSRDNTARVTDAATGETLLTISHGELYGAAWNADETCILTWSRDNTARVTDAATGDTLLIIPHDESNYGVTGAVWNADETRILTWSGDNTARVTDAATEETLLTIRHYDSDFGVSGAMWNADETRILTWSSDNTAHVTDAATGEALLTIRHDGDVKGAVWNADETRILTWSGDGDRTARVTDAASGEALLSVHHDDSDYSDSGVYGAIWNADETRILTWAEDGTARVWTTDFDYYRTLGQQRAIRSFTAEERARFFLPALTPTPSG